jgi:phospholipid/cholesterol/gamma-HCH transport system permease protein
MAQKTQANSSPTPTTPMVKTDPTDAGRYRLEQGQHDAIVRFEGRLDYLTAASVYDFLHHQLKLPPTGQLIVDLSSVSYFDDFGAVALMEMRQAAQSRGAGFKLTGISDKIQEILQLVHFDDENAFKMDRRRKSPNIVLRLGEASIGVVNRMRYEVAFLGSVLLAFGAILRYPRSLRLGDTLTCMEKTGVNAVPIVGLIGFLLGLVIAFMSSLQLAQFGANVFVASLVSIGMVSELGPIITAIVVAGRSGSAFAAEIGTMKISEEIDALVTMGLDPTLFLAIPRLIAAVIVVPLLTLFADVFAIAGGLFVGVFMLDLTAGTYMNQSIKALTVFEVCWGSAKSVIFAVLIAWIGCLRGFQTRGGADAVGGAATSAVVSSIFLIILFDSFFAVLRSTW